jgi:hypothetical protein
MPHFDPGEELLKLCQARQLEGADLPTVWTSVLRNNRLVTGKPRSRTQADGSIVLEITLATGQRLICRADGSWALA